MIKKITALLAAVCTLLSAAGAYAAPRIPVYKDGSVLYFFDKSSGTITGFAGDPIELVLPVSLGGYTVNTVGEGAFRGATTLTSLVVPQGIVSIEAEAFAACPKLTDVDISATVAFIGERAFDGCSALERVSFAAEPPEIAATAFSNTPWYTSSSEEFVILGQNTLLKYNGTAAHVTVPEGITSVAANAFSYNTSLESVSLPDGLREIGENAFVHCYALTEINIPQTVSYIGTGAFDDTAWLHNFPEPFVTINGILVSYKGGEKHVSVPNGVTGIGAGAFMGKDNLRSVKIPSTVMYIDSMAFAGCNALCAVNIPDSVQWIDEYSFSECPNLTLMGTKFSYPYYYALSHGINYSEEVYVSCNSHKIYFDNASPVIYYDRTYIPLRPVLEHIGWKVSYDAASTAIYAVLGEKKVEIFPDGRIYTNGTQNPTVAPPIFRNGAALVSMRVLAEAIGCDVFWNEETATADLVY